MSEEDVKLTVLQKFLFSALTAAFLFVIAAAIMGLIMMIGTVLPWIEIAIKTSPLIVFGVLFVFATLVLFFCSLIGKS